MCVALLVGCGGSPARVAEARVAEERTPTCKSADDCAAEVARDPGNARLRVRWGRILETDGRAAAAAREFRAAIRLAVEPTAPVEDAAEGLLRLGDAVGCVTELETQLPNASHMPTLAAAMRRARDRCADVAKKNG